jgi:hypothetical protein
VKGSQLAFVDQETPQEDAQEEARQLLKKTRW